MNANVIDPNKQFLTISITGTNIDANNNNDDGSIEMRLDGKNIKGPMEEFIMARSAFEVMFSRIIEAVIPEQRTDFVNDTIEGLAARMMDVAIQENKKSGYIPEQPVMERPQVELTSIPNKNEMPIVTKDGVAATIVFPE